MGDIRAPILQKMRPRQFFTDENRRYFDLLEKILEQLQSGGSGGGEFSSYGFGVIHPGEFFNSGELDFISVSSPYTTRGNEYIRVSSNATVTLNAEPADQEVVVVQPVSDGVTLLSGKINGDTELAISRAYDVVKLTYSLEFGEWTL